MYTMDIRLRNTRDIQTFVNLTNQFPFTISLLQGRAVTDAKSILGIYSLNLAMPIRVEVYSERAGALLEALQAYAT